jgi:hypothetical protein
MPQDFAAPYISRELSDSTTVEAGSSVDEIKGDTDRKPCPLLIVFRMPLLPLPTAHNLHYCRQEIIGARASWKNAADINSGPFFLCSSSTGTAQC